MTARLVAAVAPAVFIGSLTVAGVPQAVSEVGEVEPASLTMSPDHNQIEIGFFGFSFETGAPLRYQYRLEGAQADWSAPTDLRSVNYARLSPGSYRFLVRAVRADGALSATPASVSLTVLPPFYARWWFIALVAATVGAAGLALYRARVAQLLRVERVRARIATDLHDDIGASLSQIAILAEVARERLSHPPPGPAPAESAAAEPLARIAETSRGLVDSMSDIVWAINPEVDSLSDLVHRMRRFVEDTLGAGDVEVVFRAPESSRGSAPGCGRAAGDLPDPQGKRHQHREACPRHARRDRRGKRPPARVAANRRRRPRFRSRAGDRRQRRREHAAARGRARRTTRD